MVSVVRQGVDAKPGMAGMAGTEPVAMTNRRAAISTSPAITVRRDEARGGADHLNAEPGEALFRILGRDRSLRAPHMRHHRGEIDLEPGRRDAERAGGADIVGAPCGAISAFEGTQPVLRQSPPMLVALDQHHRHVEGGGRGGHRQAAGAGADHAQIRGKTRCHAPAGLCGALAPARS